MERGISVTHQVREEKKTGIVRTLSKRRRKSADDVATIYQKAFGVAETRKETGRERTG